LSLKFDILTLLAEREFRPSEIRERLLPKYEKKYDSNRSFDVVICRELSKLRDLVNREDKGHQLVYYSLSKRGVKELERIRSHNLIDSIDAKWLGPLRNLLIKVKQEETYFEGFLNTNCITFIGDVPCTFDKSVEGMQSHIAFVRGLRERHERELERFREEFIQSRMKGKNSYEHASVDARIRDEVGWTIGEYLKKLLKKAEKEKGVRKIMTVLGITEEMLEEMYRQRPRIYERKGP